MKKVYEGNAVVSIKVFDKSKTRITWFEFPDNWWNKINRRFTGFRDMNFFADPDIWTEEELTSGKKDDIIYIVEDKKVYHRPYVNIVFVDGSIGSRIFDTYDEACVYTKEMIEKTIKNPITI